MEFFDFFFPEQAQAQHLRTLTRKQKYREQAQKRRAAAYKEAKADTQQLEDRVKELEGDLGFVSLVLASILQTADEKGVLSRDDVRATVLGLDEVDGVRDGKLDIQILRGMNL